MLQITELSQIILWVFIICPHSESQCQTFALQRSNEGFGPNFTFYVQLPTRADLGKRPGFCGQVSSSQSVYLFVQCVTLWECDHKKPSECVCSHHCCSRIVVLTGWFDLSWPLLCFHTEKGHVKKLELKRSQNGFSIWRFAAFRVVGWSK